jgi:hypothetical protein
MKSCTYSRDGYEITSYGNGISYTVKRDGMSFHVQGDSALQLESEIDAIDQTETPSYRVADLLADYMASIGQAHE